MDEQFEDPEADAPSEYVAMAHGYNPHVQCFDLRVVEAVRQCVELRKMLVRSNPLIG